MSKQTRQVICVVARGDASGNINSASRLTCMQAGIKVWLNEMLGFPQRPICLLHKRDYELVRQQNVRIPAIKPDHYWT